MAGPRLTRDLQHSMIGGVCAGFAARYDLDVTLVRVVTVLLTVFSGGAALAVYIAAWIVMPRYDSPAPTPRAATDTPDSLGRELREVTERLSEAARVLADKSREAAEEISEIARRARTTGATAASTAPGAAGDSLTEQIDERAEEAESAPAATMSETPGMANGVETGGDVDESLSTSESPRSPSSHWSQPHSPSAPTPHPGMPPASSEQAPHQPPPPAGPVPPTPPAP